MLGLITDRTQENVDYLRSLSRKGWANMTPYERAMWTGNPMDAPGGVNLMPNGPYYSRTVNLLYRNEYIAATATAGGNYLYGVSIIGEAADFEGKTVTLSVGDITTTGDGIPQLALFWHDDTGIDSTGVYLNTSGSSGTIVLNNNKNNYAYLALYVYVSTTNPVAVGARTVYHHVMLEIGDTRHDYVPYTPILATPATLGAYNYSDLNRVEMVVEELSDRWDLGLTTKTDWGMWDVPTAGDMSRYRDNLVAIENHLKMDEVMGDIPADLSRLTFAHANAIENFLLEASKEVPT